MSNGLINSSLFVRLRYVNNNSWSRKGIVRTSEQNLLVMLSKAASSRENRLLKCQVPPGDEKRKREKY